MPFDFICHGNSNVCLNLTLTFSDICSRNVRDLDIPLEWGKIKCEDANISPIYDFQLNGNSHISIMICRLRDINSGNVCELNLDLYNGPLSNVNILIESPCATRE